MYSKIHQDQALAKRQFGSRPKTISNSDFLDTSIIFTVGNLFSHAGNIDMIIVIEGVASISLA
jgi:hypothetical protein